MKNLSGLKITTILLMLFVTINSFCQTKAERTAKTVGLKADMYNGTKSEEADKYFNMAVSRKDQTDYKEGIKLYKKAIKADPNFVEAYDNMALCYRKIGDFKNAIENYKKSIELYPDGHMAHMNLGIIYIIQKEFNKALDEYAILQKINPDDPEGYYGTINIYLQLKDYDSAIKNALKTIEIYEATNSEYLNQAQFLLGTSYYYNKDKENAKIYFKLAKKGGFPLPKEIIEEFNIE